VLETAEIRKDHTGCTIGSLKENQDENKKFKQRQESSPSQNIHQFQNGLFIYGKRYKFRKFYICYLFI